MAPREPERTQAWRFNFYVALNVTALWAFTKGQSEKRLGKIDKTMNEFGNAYTSLGFREPKPRLKSDVVAVCCVDGRYKLLCALMCRINENIMRTAGFDNIA